MKRLLLACLLIFAIQPAHSDPLVPIARTNENALNDLIGRVPIVYIPRDRDARRLSALQELIVVHEMKMRGEGLPPALAAAFSSNYTSIIAALVEDRIPEDYGCELLKIHRELLGEAHDWVRSRYPLEDFPELMLERLAFYQGELQTHAIMPWEVPDSLRTPVINGYQVWAHELISWGEGHWRYTPGPLTRVERKLEELQRFEGYFKRDGVLYPSERQQLHGRFLKITRETIEELGKLLPNYPVN
ncbi:MAG: hypothetical protein AAGA96_05045 [Verrucomicrobiota bacterium]